MMSSVRSSYFESSFDYRSLLPSSSRTDSADETGIDYNNADDDGCSCFPDMSWRERILGCVTCMVAGYLLSLGSFWRIRDLIVNHDPVPFVLNSTIGNIISLAGSFFLSGPTTQLRAMWAEKRRTATLLYVGSLGLTLVLTFTPLPGPKGVVLLFLVLCQYVAITWYCLSYIPFAHDIVLGYVRRRFGAGN